MTKLHAILAEPAGTDVIRTLEEVLEQAAAGKLSSVAVAVVYRDGSTSRSWSSAPSMSTLIGASARLHAALIRTADE